LQSLTILSLQFARILIVCHGPEPRGPETLSLCASDLVKLLFATLLVHCLVHLEQVYNMHLYMNRPCAVHAHVHGMYVLYMHLHMNRPCVQLSQRYMHMYMRKSGWLFLVVIIMQLVCTCTCLSVPAHVCMCTHIQPAHESTVVLQIQ
jgi:hypothetical protein